MCPYCIRKCGKDWCPYQGVTRRKQEARMTTLKHNFSMLIVLWSLLALVVIDSYRDDSLPTKAASCYTTKTCSAIAKLSR